MSRKSKYQADVRSRQSGKTETLRREAFTYLVNALTSAGRSYVLLTVLKKHRGKMGDHICKAEELLRDARDLFHKEVK